MSLAFEVIADAWVVLNQMAPYLLFGFLVAGLLSVVLTPAWTERHLGADRGWLPVVKAALFGVPLPLCSCGVIPVGAALRRHGASRGATLSFLLSTPQTGVDSIAVTWSLLGPVFAVYRPFVAFLTGLFGGGLAHVLVREEEAAAAGQAPAGECRDACCEPEGESAPSWWRRALRHGFLTLPADIGGALFFGVAVAGVLGALVPEQFFAETLGCGWTQMVLMMLVGIPLYICSTASVPVAAAMLAKGICPGAVLVFLVTGPATNAATISTIWKVLGRRSAVIYLGTVAVTAMLAGWGLEAILTETGGGDEHVHGAEGGLLYWVEQAAAVLLLAVLGFSRWHGGQPAPQAASAGGDVVVLAVKGMTCAHCAASVAGALEALAGVESATVSLAEEQVAVRGTGLDIPALLRAVEAQGYSAAPAVPASTSSCKDDSTAS